MKYSLALGACMLAVSFATITAHAQDYKEKFCDRAIEQKQQQDIALSANRLAFENAGGAFNGGVCWWHSHLQRDVSYLALFRPDLAAPKNTREVMGILRNLRAMNQVVVIPGYADFQSFSKAWQKTVQRFLNQWQIYDAALYGAWIDGLSGSTRANAAKLQATMIKLKEEVLDHKHISYLKLQLKGISAHAWLVYSAQETADGLKLGIIDSNFLQPVEYLYHWGDASITTQDYGAFMPYLEHADEFQEINRILAQYCS